MKNIAIIPARSGSKALKDKNITLINGKPLMAYSIEAAIQSECFDVVMVSTDSKQYRLIAEEYKAQVPFLRSPQNSLDTSSPWDVVKEVLDNYAKLGKEFDNFMLLQPTSPLRNAQDIKNAFALMEEKKANAIVSMCELECSPHLINKLPEDHSLKNFISQKQYNKRRQDIEPYYRFNGAIYLSKVATFYKDPDIYQNECYAYIMDRKRSYDIDEQIDLTIVQAILKEEK